MAKRRCRKSRFDPDRLSMEAELRDVAENTASCWCGHERLAHADWGHVGSCSRIECPCVAFVKPESVARAVAVLERENAKVQGGRGSSAVASMVAYLRSGRPDLARLVWNTDKDKVRQYPGLYAAVVKVWF